MLNENQNIAKEHFNGPMMVLAGPGSGKTTVITARAAILVQQVKHLLVITYSKSAASEMERRFREQSPLANNITFGTFHSVFFRMLRRKNNHNLEQIIADGERKNIVRSFLAERNYDIEDDFLSTVLNEMSLIRNELHELVYYNSSTMGADDFRELCRAYELYKTEQNKIDFDDMLCNAYTMLQDEPKELAFWRQKYPYIMIDEFQDINCVQYEAIRLLAAPQNNLLIVGDDDQSIYRFRGSRPEFLLNFPNDYPETQKVTLDTNYRSTDVIIKYANDLIISNEMRYSKSIVGTGQKGPKPIILTADDQNREAVSIAERIRDMWKKGANLNEIAVTYRLNIQARAFMDAFLNMNIPFRSRDEMPSIYEHWIAEDIYAYLQLAQRIHLRQKVGYDPNAVRIINKPYRYISKAFLQWVKKENLDIFRAYKSKDSGLHFATKNKIEELLSDLKSLARRNTVDAIRYIRQNLGYNTHILDICDYRKLKPSGLLEIADELQEAAKQFKKSDDFIAHAKATAELTKANEPAGDCCTLTTLHSAKGLEFEKVFIAGVVEDVIPYARSRTDAEIEEERRLLYVGVTRAKHELYLSTIKSRYDKPTKPSRFITSITRS